MNVFSFTGNLGSDCKTNTVGNTAVCNFSVAVRSGYGDKEQTHWIDVALWGKQAESRLPEYLVKGQSVAVSGELGTREHNGKMYLTCRASSVSLTGGKGETRPAPQATSAPAPQAAPADGVDDDIPF